MLSCVPVDLEDLSVMTNGELAWQCSPYFTVVFDMWYDEFLGEILLLLKP